MLLIGLSLMLVSCDAGLRAGKYPDAEAESLYKRSYGIFLSRLGPDHPNALKVFGIITKTFQKPADRPLTKKR